MFEQLETSLSKLENPRVDIYFHKDFDGIGSGLAMLEIVSQYSTNIHFKEIQYGQYLNQLQPEGDYNILVDFAQAFDGINFHTDHHQLRDSLLQSENPNRLEFFYPGAKSNAAILFYEALRSKKVSSEKELLYKRFAKAANIIDSAGYSSIGLTPTLQRQTVQDRTLFDRNVPLKHRAILDFFPLNRVFEAFKNKTFSDRSFYEKFMSSCSSLDPSNMLALSSKLALELQRYDTRKNQYVPLFPKNFTQRDLLIQLQKNSDAYVKQFSESKIPKQVNLTNGKKLLYLNYGEIPIASTFAPGSYDRYVPFEVYPDTTFLMTDWEKFGLLQVSYNPAINKQDHHLGDITKRAIKKVANEFPDKKANLGYFKKQIKKNAPAGKLISPPQSLLDTLLGKGQLHAVDLQLREATWNELSAYEFNAWDLIRATAGGHKSITNISGLDVFGKYKRPIAHRLMQCIVNEIEK